MAREPAGEPLAAARAGAGALAFFGGSHWQPFFASCPSFITLAEARKAASMERSLQGPLAPIFWQAAQEEGVAAARAPLAHCCKISRRCQ